MYSRLAYSLTLAFSRPITVSDIGPRPFELILQLDILSLQLHIDSIVY